MLGFKTEFGLTQQSQSIAHPPQKTSHRQPRVTRCGLGISRSPQGDVSSASLGPAILRQSDLSPGLKIPLLPMATRGIRGENGGFFPKSV